MLALLTQTAINLVDTYFIGKLPEPERTDGQAMLSFSLTLLWAVGGFLSAISVGTQATVGRREGQSHPHDSGAVLANAVVLATVASGVATLVFYPLIPWVFQATSVDPDYIRIGTGYTQWRFVGLMSMVITAAYKAFYDGTGRTYVHLCAAIGMNVVNAVLCWLLIFGNFGFPRMGVEGAGFAAAISSWVGAIAMLLFSLRPSDRTKYHPYRRGVLSLTIMKDLARLSIPSGVATTVVMTGFILFIRIVHVFDDALAAQGVREAIYGAATTIIINVLSLTFFSCMAFGVATATLVSQSLGAGDSDAAERYAWSSVKIAVVLFGLLGAHEIAFPQFWIGIFNQSPAVIRAGEASMRLMGATGPLIAAGMILTQALFGAGNPRFVMMVELMLHFGVLLPVAWLLGVVFHGGLLGVWSSAAVYAVLLTSIMAWKFRSGTWKTIVI
ncbi:MAG TPA: MATE family efflux transporter [Polyangiales bacterium]|nr:MATE family efflux transporter [Polyangiales bacterium]